MAERPGNPDLPPLRPRDGSGALGRLGRFAENPATGTGNTAGGEPAQPVQRPFPNDFADLQRRRAGLPPETGVAGGGGRGEDAPPRRRKEREGEPGGPESWWPTEVFGAELWGRLEDKPDYRAYLAMQYYQNLDWDKRSQPQISKKFKQAGLRLDEYALSKKHLRGKNGEPLEPKIAEIYLDIDFYDNAEVYKGTNSPDGRRVDTYNDRQKRKLQNLLGSLNELERLQEALNKVTIDPGLSGLRITALRDYLGRTDLNDADRARIQEEIKILEEYIPQVTPYTEEAAKVREKKLQEVARDLSKTQEGIIALTGSAFLEGRKAVKESVNTRVKAQQDKEKDDKKLVTERDKSFRAAEDSALENKYEDSGPIPVLEISDFATPSPEIIDIVNRMQKAAAEPDPAKREQISLWDLEELFDALPSFSEVSTELRNMRRASKTEDNINNINRLRRLTGWYIYHARENMLLDGLDIKLEKDESDFSTWVTMLGRGQESPKDMDTLGKIIDGFSLYTGKDGTRYAKTQGDLEAICDRMDLPIAIAGKFSGIRELMLRRGYNRIRDEINGLVRGGNNEMVIDNQGDLSDPFFYTGEWDLRKLNYLRDKPQEVGVKEQYYEKSNFGYVQLTGANAAQIEQGASDYMTNLLDSNSAYDLQQLLTEMKSLSAEIGRAGQLRGLSKETIANIQNSISNRAFFKIIDFTGSILNMDVSFNAGLQWCDGTGDARAKYIPQMEKGMVGLAMHMLNQPENILFFRPEGWQGQLTNMQEGQRLLRDNANDQIVARLMEYELDPDVDPKVLSQWQKTDQEFQTDNYRRALFTIDTEYGLRDVDIHGLRAEIERLKKLCKERIDSVTGKKPSLLELREIRDIKARSSNAEHLYSGAEERAKQALKFAIQVDNVFGESAERGAPSVRTKKGDRIALPHIIMALTHAVKEASKKTEADLRRKGLECTNYSQLIRQRAMVAALNYVNVIPQETVKGANGEIVKYDFKLQKGFEDTGLTEEEFAAVLNAYSNIWEEGFNAVIEGKTLSQIVKTDELKAVTNNYLANDAHGKDAAFGVNTRELAARGELPYFASVYKRLEWFGLDQALIEIDKTVASLDGQNDDAAHENSRRALVQVIENSRSLESMLSKLTYYFATRKNINHVKQAIEHVNRTPEPTQPDATTTGVEEAEKAREHYMEQYEHSNGIFRSGDVWHLNIYMDYTEYTNQHLVMEYPSLNLGYKRLRNLKTRWFTRDDEFTARGIESVIWMPIAWQDFNSASSSRNSLETIWNIDREILDIYQMQLHFHRGQDMLGIQKYMETNIDEKGEVGWAYLYKTLSDPEALNKLQHHAHEILAYLYKSSGTYDPSQDVDTSFIEGTVEPFRAIFRDEKLLGLFVLSMADHRGAIDSGAAWEEMVKWRRRGHHQHFLSRKPATRKREQGGLAGYSRTASIMTAFLMNDTYLDGKSIESREWEKQRPAVDTQVLEYSSKSLPLALARVAA